MSILFVRQDKLGDCLLATSTLSSLRAARPEEKLFVVCQRAFTEIFDRHPAKPVVLETSYRLGPLGILREAVRWKALNAAAVLLPKEDSGDHTMAAWLAGVPARIGQTKKWHGRFLSANFMGRLDESLHEIRLMNRMAEEAVGGTLPEMPLSFDPLPQEQERAEALLDGIGGHFVICPLTGGTSAQWPADRFRQLGEMLCELTGLTAIIAAGPNQVKQAEEAARFPGALNIAGQAGLGELASVFKSAAFVVSVNSGLIHLAAAQETPVCVIETRDDHASAARRWSPWMTKSLVVAPDPEIPSVERVFGAASALVGREAPESS